MGWTAHTAFENVVIGTVFAVLFEPQIQGEEIGQPAVGDQMTIAPLSGERRTCTVVESSPNEIIFQMDDDESQWRMTPVASGEPGSAIRFRGMKAEDWTVREQV